MPPPLAGGPSPCCSPPPTRGPRPGRKGRRWSWRSTWAAPATARRRRSRSAVAGERKRCPPAACFAPTRWDPSTCSCGCPRQEFGEQEAACEQERHSQWDKGSCRCHPRRARVSGGRALLQPSQVVERGVDAQQQYDPCTDLSRMHYSPRCLLHCNTPLKKSKF